ncbi:MAG TPA: serine O-acetyltransferase [Rhizomicrobium sp.]|jgi:serine O-acetyltransferase|nr:serine O-acetyltransferase [Rhizomicrobium sp.]
MPIPAERLALCDPIWSALRAQAQELSEKEPSLASLAHATILNHVLLEDALSYHLARKIGGEEVSAMQAREVFDEALEADPNIGEAVRADLSAVFERDPACHSYVQAFLFFKGFHALQCHRIAHWLWLKGRTTFAYFLQSRVSQLFAVDIHPAARMGRGIMMDHATGIVIGETAVVEDDVSMLHGVTLGGSGKEKGDRHPKIRRGVLLSAGAKVLGNIEVGENSRVGAGSVVIQPVPPNCTVAGVPARVIGCAGSDRPSQTMDQRIDAPGTDPAQRPQS